MRINLGGKMNRVIANCGSEHVNVEKLKAVEAISMSVVAVLAVTLGTIYGSML
jgi:hypothetical protein